MKSIIISFLFILITGCSSKPHIVNHTEEDSAFGNNDIYIVSHGWHTGFVIPSSDIYPVIPELRKRFFGSLYIEFGWGDKGFYQAKEITSGLTLRAIFWPTESVIHSVAVPTSVYKYFPDSMIKEINLSDRGLQSLVKFISNSFHRNEEGKVIELKNGIYGNSQFYKGVGDYYLMNTCNKWTAKGLKSAGMDISTTFKLTADSIINYLSTRGIQP
jgi:uncharacterized protein (TIGR02117 family)